MSANEDAAATGADADRGAHEGVGVDLDVMRALEAEALARAAADDPIEDDDRRTVRLVRALTEGTFYGTLTQALDEIAEFHPPRVMDALFRGLVLRDGEVACHLAAMLAFLYGKAESIFDWELRPLFLTFNTDYAADRLAACSALSELIEVDPAHIHDLLAARLT